MRDQDGYTLTEMLVVIAVIGLIAAVLTPNLIGQLGRSRVKAAELQLQSVAAAIEMFQADNGRYPTSAEGLSALVSAPMDSNTWTGPYLKNTKMLKDPWGAPLIYNATGDGYSFTVGSLGADGKSGGTGVNRDLQEVP